MRFLLPLLILLLLSGCNRKPETGGYQGYVEGDFLYMAAPAAGILQSLEVKEGDIVSSGTLLFAMDPTKEQAAVAEAMMKLSQAEALLEDARQGQRPTEIAALEAQVKQAEARLVLSLKVLERQVQLSRSEVIPEEDLDRARSVAQADKEAMERAIAELATARLGQRTKQVEAAEANVEMLKAVLAQTRWNLEQTTQTAPQDAAVFDVYFRRGEFVPAGRPVVSLLPPGNVKVRTFVPEADIGALSLGTAATVLVDGVARVAEGTVSFISPKAEFTPPVIYSQEMRQKLSFLVEISFPADTARNLHPGQPVDVRFEDEAK